MGMSIPTERIAWRKRSERRRKRRRASDLTLAAVAGLIGISESCLHRWERGSRRPTREQERQWDAALQMHTSEIKEDTA